MDHPQGGQRENAGQDRPYIWRLINIEKTALEAVSHLSIYQLPKPSPSAVRQLHFQPAILMMIPPALARQRPYQIPWPVRYERWLPFPGNPDEAFSATAPEEFPSPVTSFPSHGLSLWLGCISLNVHLPGVHQSILQSHHCCCSSPDFGSLLPDITDGYQGIFR